jgi:hypothetical protein
MNIFAVLSHWTLVWSQKNSVTILTLYLASILIFFSLPLQIFRLKPCTHYLFPHAFYIPARFITIHLITLVILDKLLTRVFPSPCHFLRLRFRYSSRRPDIMQSQYLFSLGARGQIVHPCKRHVTYLSYMGYFMTLSVYRLLSRVLITVDGIWIVNWIYWSPTGRKYK